MSEEIESYEEDVEGINEGNQNFIEEVDIQTEESKEEVSEDNIDSDDDVVTDEMLDQIADTAIAVLQDVLKHFNFDEVTIDEYEGDEGELILDITGDDLAVLIGRHGKTLDALQFLVSAITLRTLSIRYPVVIDVNGYKARQRVKLEGIANNAARKAVSQGRSIKLRPMTPYERRIVHIALRDDERVTTASEGEGSNRHVVVFPAE